jgi:hypothetical protein
MIRKGSGLPLVQPNITDADIADARRVSYRGAPQAARMFDATEMAEEDQDGPIPDLENAAS